MPVPDSPLLRKRLDEMRQNERVAPYFYWLFLLVVLGLMSFAARPAYMLAVAVPFLVVFVVHLRRPVLVRALSVGHDHVFIEIRGERAAVRFGDVATCVALPVSWDDSTDSPFMKSLVRLVLTLSEPVSGARRVTMLEGRDRTVSRALSAAGVAVTSPRWASKYDDETGMP